MKHLLFSTTGDWAGFILRILLGAIMLPHGAQKLFGWFGGYGFTPTMQFFTDTLKLPWIIGLLVITLEFFGAAALIAGFASKVWAFGLLVVMVGAIITTNYKHGLFMNWFGTQQGEGYEYHLLVIGICLVIMLLGSGRLSLDNWIEK
ncbi:DoxX family protein [Fulvivirgaceae bacterium PWU4]|uniref:DoxX family protein n=1 Tax=Chryseosolibacter histidini TaxID=2782349 RepID=A0AAP2GJI0_9BACT|nr:DoxX family protein [Chryseosolibacter histidini]MBT1698034.1 DoxX family protein [Chryseosolibacter histidini]